MRALILMSQFYQLGGAERLAVQLAQGLNSAGWQADIVSMYRRDLPAVREAEERLRAAGVRNIHYLGLTVDPSPLSVIGAISRLRAILRSSDYQILETSLISPTIIGAWAVRGTSTRHVAGIHQVFLRDRERSFASHLLRATAHLNPRTRYYAISSFAADAWRRYAGISASRIRRVYNGIADDYFEAQADRAALRAELGVPADARIALYVGRLAAYKRIDTPLEALKGFLKERGIYLVYAGAIDQFVPGTSDMLERMRHAIASLGLEDHVRFLGFRKDTARLMSSADVLVHVTEADGFGLAVVEALAAGLPVVASDVEAIPEVLEGSGALLVDPADVSSIERAVLATLERSDADTAAVIAKGRQRAADFRLKRRTQAMIRLFEDVVAERF